MTENQKDFLKALDELLKKHNVNAMRAGASYVSFESNGDTIKIGDYENGKFKHIVNCTGSYKP